jgi:hypothetical protein
VPSKFKEVFDRIEQKSQEGDLMNNELFRARSLPYAEALLLELEIALG